MEKTVLGPPVLASKSRPTSSDEKAPDSSDNATSLRRVGWPKGKKRKKLPKESMDPQKPLSAYHWFIKENREKIRNENPTWGFTEISKKLAQDWKALSTEQRQQYMLSAEEDKERYARELSVYKNRSVMEELVSGKDDGSGFDIPIFTEEFLDHNKIREAELRQLRKSNTDYEQQNSILEKLIENTKTAITKLEEETVQQRCHNQALQQHLDQMRVTLTDAFGEIELPGDNERPTLQTIDSYMVKLHGLLLTQNTTSPLYVRVREVVQQLDLHG
ncbi:UNVERIFIED_CONTAM: hypothetical protein PYX00_006929 [Menopon gallinae]|uniref:HMG box domain-containing protein n=1 Tax=Menopon gallinae TaxID=328185 RepID=A0AAW2HH86_9NEOP